MYKLLNFLCAIVLGVMAACSSAPSSSESAPTSTENTVRDVDTSTATFSSTPQPTLTNLPLISRTPTLPPPPEFGEIWTDDGEALLAATLGAIGFWSPSRDEMVVYQCGVGFRIVAIVSPAFAPRELYADSDTECVSNHPIIWSIDGNKIYFVGPVTGTDPDFLWLHSIWSFNRTNVFDIAPLLEGTDYFWPDLIGWMGPNTLVIMDAMTGGNAALNFTNIGLGRNTGYVYTQGIVIQGLNRNYLIVQYPDHGGFHMAGFTPNVHTEDLPLGEQRDNPEIRFFPEGDLNQQTLMTRFLDWRGDTNIMLVAWTERADEAEEGFISKLLFWNMDNGELYLPIPNAGGGKLSPDGRWLTYLAPDEGLMLNEELHTYQPCESDDLDRRLNLVDLWDERLVLSVSINFSCEVDEFGVKYRYPLIFSDDGSRVAFITQTDLQNGEDGSISVIRTSAENNLYVLDLSAGQIEYTTQDVMSIVGWGSDGGRLLYQDSQGRLNLLNLDNRTIIELTIPEQEFLFDASWSPSGRYVALSVVYAESLIGNAILRVP